MEKIQAKEGNLSISLYVGGETQAQSDAAAESTTTALPMPSRLGWKAPGLFGRFSKHSSQPNESATFKSSCDFNFEFQLKY